MKEVCWAMVKKARASLAHGFPVIFRRWGEREICPHNASIFNAEYEVDGKGSSSAAPVQVSFGIHMGLRLPEGTPIRIDMLKNLDLGAMDGHGGFTPGCCRNPTFLPRGWIAFADILRVPGDVVSGLTAKTLL